MLVIFARSNHIISRLIRWRTKSQWSHVGIIDNGYVIEAAGKQGVVKPSLADFYSRYSTTEIRQIPGDINKARAKLGAKFDMWGIWGIAFRVHLQHADKWFCSELVALAATHIADEYAHLVSPGVLYWISHRLP